ncbi:hypothetical protein AB4455_10575 [Vibrio sp. 10N.261.46.E12]|uniref:hypothetical protein n=1 Tax=unclassified Vibrio TaxID=2614977 RepID=UPI000976C787|nr:MULTISPECIES: hypothetical protein [unclassified Vibrio]OMO36085.1 hypothetical protein BH584_04745 [Vibrio sp. 10N.261.45.E1]PMJ34563.1 hypothetical protein BCU27_03790 [Vibrio sp. 10N.286.45.B6]PML88091.1 hypothetical protein BCT66_10860 [Vibrio sp. 10N.261.49.E11]PMM67419.1 hypothetical protein BCT48_15335 [Vibrio sp. 10N.261.46.F12]PMM81698.1 hypothetical protein BCT46_14925 [Vibrio sp. 10N.261.46.E8]
MSALRFILTSTAFFAALFIGSTFYFSVTHHNKVADLYELVGQNYDAIEHSQPQIEHLNPILRVFDTFYRPKGALISPWLFRPEQLENAGLGQQCSGVEYTKLFRDDIDASVFEEAKVCCAPQMITDMSPIVLDEKNDRILVMCGLSGDAHVIAMESQNFVTLINSMGSGDSPVITDVYDLFSK